MPEQQPENKTSTGNEKSHIQYRKLNNTLTTKQALIVIGAGVFVLAGILVFQVFFNDSINENDNNDTVSEENDNDEESDMNNDDTSESSGDFVIETRERTSESPDVMHNGVGGPENLPIINVREGVLHYHNAGSGSCPPAIERVSEERLNSYVLHIADYSGMACTMDYVPIYQTITHADEDREFSEDSDFRVNASPSLEADAKPRVLPTPDMETPDVKIDADENN